MRRLLLKRYRTLIIAMLLFVGLELMMVALFAYFANEAADNAQLINLSGRQRMLSQRTAKALFALEIVDREKRPQSEAMADLEKSNTLFGSTLVALEQGGVASTSAGVSVDLKPVNCQNCPPILAEIRELWAPLHKASLQVLSTGGRDEAAFQRALQLAVERNEKILDLANEFTVKMERLTVTNAQRILTVQVGAAVMAIGNFLFILLFVLRSLQTRDQKLRRLANVAERTNNLVVITDAARRIIWVNESFTRVSGYTAAEALGKHPGKLLQGEATDAATVALMHDKLSRGEGFADVEILNYTKLGKPYWVELAVKPVLDDTGELLELIAIQSDITARKHEAARLQRSAVLLEGLRAAEAESLHGSNMTAGFDRMLAVLLTVSDRSSGLMAEVRDEHDGQAGLFLYALSSRPIAWPALGAERNAAGTRLHSAALYSAMQATWRLPMRQHLPAQALLSDASGNERPYLCIPLVHDGRLMGLIAIERDAAQHAAGADFVMNEAELIAFLQPLLLSAAQLIAAQRTDERRRAAELRSRELAEQLKIIGDNIPGGAIYQMRRDADSKAQYLYASEGFRNMLGITPEEILRDADNLHRHIHPDDLPILNAAREASRSTMQAFDCTYRRITSEGRIIWTHVRAMPKPLDDGAMVWNGVVLDVTERKLQEAELKERENRLQHLTAQIPGMVYQFQMFPDGSFSMPYASRGMVELVGYSLAEVNKDPSLIFASVHADDRQALHESIFKSARSMDRWEHEYRIIRDNGDIEWRQGSSQPEPLADGSILWHGFLTDITRRKLAQEKLARITFLMDRSQSLAQVGGWELNVADGSQFWTPETYRIHDTSPEEHTPTLASCLACYTPDSYPVISAAVEDAIRTGSSFDLELQLISTKQRAVWVRVSSSAVTEDGQVVRLMGAMQDITTRKQSEAALIESERLFSSIFDTAYDAFITIDADQHIVLFNKAAERMFGYSAESIIGQSLARLLPPAERSGKDHERENTFGTMLGTTRRDVSGMRANGEIFPVETTMSPLTVNDKQIFAAFIRDTSERQRAEALQLAKDTAELANHAKSEFLAHMSHELRTPLNSILGFAQLLEYDAAVKSTEPAMKKVRNIRTAGAHLLSMIDDILDLSRIEVGGMTLSLEALDVDILIRECISLIAPQTEARELSVAFTPPNVPCHVLADRTRLRQILVNLLSNAVKYNRMRGAIDIARHGGKDWVELSIRDSGRGLTPEQQERLFQPFNRLGAEMSSTEGTGIGLVIVRQLVEKMGGNIRVDSKHGEGATFVVTLPASRAPESVQFTPLDSPSRSGAHSTANVVSGRYTILYIEDNPANVELIQQFLAMRPEFTLEVATDGISGLARARSLRPDLLLLDINLPGIDGFEVMRQLKSDPELAAIPVVALSANAMPDELRRAVSSGFVDYLTKPIDLRRLLATIENELDDKITGKSFVE